MQLSPVVFVKLSYFCSKPWSLIQPCNKNWEYKFYHLFPFLVRDTKNFCWVFGFSFSFPNDVLYFPLKSFLVRTRLSIFLFPNGCFWEEFGGSRNSSVKRKFSVDQFNVIYYLIICKINHYYLIKVLSNKFINSSIQRCFLFTYRSQ